MFGNRRKAVLVSAALLGGTMLMTACQDSDVEEYDALASPTASSPGQTAPATPGSSGTGGEKGGGNASPGKASGGQGTTTDSGSGDKGTVAKCRTTDLNITAVAGVDPDSVAVTMENIAKDCSMSGFAGVDLQTAEGSLSAKRVGEPAETFTLKSGKSVSFSIGYPVNDTGGSGVRITGLLVTPPGETKTVTIPWPGGASLPVTDGSGAALTVGPIGSAGQGEG